jgi:murein DD-endopeptidase MepM/ murein hydrolase activator NlpD
VVSSGWNNWGYGYRVVIDHGNGYSTTYNHLSVISVRSGQVVGKGQQVGLMGSTGRSTGPHLHFEILRGGSYVNPLGALG